MEGKIQCEVSFMETIQTVLKDSGRGFFRRGQYYDCIEQSNMKYSVIELGAGGVDTSIFSGLCLPKQCSNEIITNSVNKTKLSIISF